MLLRVFALSRVHKFPVVVRTLASSSSSNVAAQARRTAEIKFLKPQTPVVVCYYCFRARGSWQLDAEGKGEHQSNDVTEEEIFSIISSLVKKLNLDKKEALAVRLGFQKGLRMSAASRSDGKSVKKQWSSFKISIFQPLIYAALFIVAMLIITLYFPSTFNKLVSIGKTDFRAEIPDVTFEDVKGIDEVKQELLEIVEFLMDPERFTSLGAKLPKGMLLVGPPGTGKTLLARAIAGEAGVPFYYASGSEFDEMFVGVGSARIRNLFADARDNAPCIIFIDEIDACGNKRTSSPLQPYARQTINQLLQEMDGFEAKEGVIVLGATNMGKVLDKALTRPGRFDTEIKVLPPDVKGRKDILELYVKKVLHGNDLDLERIACLTGGMTGADLSNLVNQAALRAAQLEKSFVEMVDLEYALDKLRLGPELKSRIRTERELEVTAFHEAGHALVAFHTPESMPVFKVTITQRGAALGHTSVIPRKEDENSATKIKIMGRIDMAMGGRVAEEILRGGDNVTTGASNDLQYATDLAYKLVCEFGMSERLGFVTYDMKNVSPRNKAIIESEVNNILAASYERVKQLLSKYSAQHKLLAKALLKYETLSLKEMEALFAQNSLEAVRNLRNTPTVEVGKTILPSAEDLSLIDGLTR